MPRIPRFSVVFAVPALALPIVLAGCDGQIGEPSPLLSGIPGARTDAGPGSTPDGGPSGGPEFDPFEGGGATLGFLCDASGARGRLVLTAEPGGCGRHAELLSGGTPSGDRALVDAPVIDRAGTYEANGEVCIDGDCQTRSVRIEVDALDDNGAIGRWSIPLEGRTAAGALQASRCAYDAHLPGRDPNLAPNLAITEVALYQGVKTTLAESGAEAPRATPVVEGRPGLLRVFVEPQVGFLQSRIEAVLTLDQGGGGEPSVRRSRREIAIASREASRGTTFEFPLSANDIGASARWSVALRGEAACSGIGQDTSGARYPTSGDVALDAERVGTLDVTLVPFRYNADGSGRLPDTSEQQLDRYEEILFGMFPVEAVNISVREPVDLELTVTPASSSWGPVLQRLFSVRASDNPPPNTYYYGIFRPVDGGGWSGTAGLGPLPSAPDVGRRGAIGLGNTGFGSARTAAHELGHAAGRSHAPCGGAGNPDPGFPHAEGSIGVWGYDIVSDTLKDPATARDFMGYCNNDWVSDYTYSALVDRYSFVNQSVPDVIGPPSLWRSLYLAKAGWHHWEDPVRLDRPPGADATLPVRYLDAGGAVLAADEAAVIELDHDDGIFAWLPAAPAGTTRVELAGRVTPY